MQDSQPQRPGMEEHEGEHGKFLILIQTLVNWEDSWTRSLISSLTYFLLRQNHLLNCSRINTPPSLIVDLGYLETIQEEIFCCLLLNILLLICFRWMFYAFSYISILLQSCINYVKYLCMLEKENTVSSEWTKNGGKCSWHYYMHSKLGTSDKFLTQFLLAAKLLTIINF